MVYAVIAAGGIGSRFGADKPKQLLEIENESILRKTVGVFEKIEQIAAVVVACPSEWMSQCREELKDFEKVSVVCGGETRNDSVINAAEFIKDNFETDEKTIVVTHDAVRPFVSEKIILDSIDSAEKFGASVAAVEAVDTVIECQDGFIKRVPDRSKIFHVQTPQTFLLLKLLELYETLGDSEKAKLTDCSGIFVSRNERVAVVKGDRANKKITYREDI